MRQGSPGGNACSSARSESGISRSRSRRPSPRSSHERSSAWATPRCGSPRPSAAIRSPSASWLLAKTERLIVATGIANIYARDPAATAAAQKTLAEQSGGRFLLGLGVSHRPMVEGVRGHVYASPVATMKAYLERMAKAPYMAVPPPEPPPTVLAALGPQMLKLRARA